MIVFWAAAGGATAMLLFGMQYLQVKRLSPSRNYSGWSIAIHFLVRLGVFAGLFTFALLQNATHALIFFAGFWLVRSLALVRFGVMHQKGLSMEKNQCNPSSRK